MIEKQNKINLLWTQQSIHTSHLSAASPLLTWPVFNISCSIQEIIYIFIIWFIDLPNILKKTTQLDTVFIWLK